LTGEAGPCSTKKPESYPPFFLSIKQGYQWLAVLPEKQEGKGAMSRATCPPAFFFFSTKPPASYMGWFIKCSYERKKGFLGFISKHYLVMDN
jgi:hypothetical protein